MLEPLPTRIEKLDEGGMVVIKGRIKGYEDLTYEACQRPPGVREAFKFGISRKLLAEESLILLAQVVP